VIRARFRAGLPPDLWIRELSEAFPATTFRLLAGVQTDGGGAMELGEVVGGDVGGALEAMAAHPSLAAVEPLHAGDERALVQYETGQQELYQFLGDASLPVEFPVVATDGTMEFDITTTRDRFETMADRLSASPYGYELLSVVHADGDEDLLTDRQREALRAALRAGYFEVPRRCTLAEVADRLGVDKSTASETIRRGQARVVEWFLFETE
jgi:hypothetical protein